MPILAKLLFRGERSLLTLLRLVEARGGSLGSACARRDLC